MKKVLAVLLVALAMTACGGGGFVGIDVNTPYEINAGDSTSPTDTSEPLDADVRDVDVVPDTNAGDETEPPDLNQPDTNVDDETEPKDETEPDDGNEPDDGVVDPECDPEDQKTYYKDEDDDGYGVTNDRQELCVPKGFYTATKSGDCNDGEKTVHPGAMEKCDGVDNDCDGTTDQGDSLDGCVTMYKDSDDDGYGDASDSACICEGIETSYVEDNTDCCDQDARANPGATDYYADKTKCETNGLEWDYDCSRTNETEETRVNGGCEAYLDGCNQKLGWNSSEVPACGVETQFLTGGCGKACWFNLCCAGAEWGTKTQRCH